MNTWKLEFKILLFTIASKKINYLSVNLTKCVLNQYAENYKMLIREIKDLSKQRDIPCSQTRRLNIEKMAILSKLMYSFNAISIRIPAKFSVGIDKPIVKLIRKGKRTRIAEQS